MKLNQVCIFTDIGGSHLFDIIGTEVKRLNIIFHSMTNKSTDLIRFSSFSCKHQYDLKESNILFYRPSFFTNHCVKISK